MGWNSYDTFGSSVTEPEVLANAQYMKDHLAAHGWKFIVVDYRWSDAHATEHPLDGVKGNPLSMDRYGRLTPAVDRFPSSAGNTGFKTLSDRIHGMGLQFGIHVMRGIPRQAVLANAPIENSRFHAQDAADTNSTCTWCQDMFGIKGDSPAGQAYYDSLFLLYASWGVDFVKVDDLSGPYHEGEITMIRKAIDRCGRKIIFSTSPGETPLENANHIETHANMWRISGDFWDTWKSLDDAFDLAAIWQGHSGVGHWPDLDMIPFGHIAIRSKGQNRMTRLKHDEEVMLMSLWALSPSPLMLGMNLPDNDEATLKLITNDEVLSIDQDVPTDSARLLGTPSLQEVWVRNLKDGSKAVGFFNRGDTATTMTLKWKEAGLNGRSTARDVWEHRDIGTFQDSLSVPVNAHGAVLLRMNAVK